MVATIERFHSMTTEMHALFCFFMWKLSEGLGLIPGKIKYPLGFTPESCKGKFKFGPPSAVRVVGSYLLGTLTKPDLNVDLELSLPVVRVGRLEKKIFLDSLIDLGWCCRIVFKWRMFWTTATSTRELSTWPFWLATWGRRESRSLSRRSRLNVSEAILFFQFSLSHQKVR